MFSVFTTTKAFTNWLDRNHQVNAIKSWKRLCDDIIVFGDENGTAEHCEQLNVQHVPEVEKNEFGTPYIKDLFSQAKSLAKYENLCYINADIMLMDDFVSSVECLESYHDFLVTGRRYNIYVDDLLDFDTNWEILVKEKMVDHGSLAGFSSMDYFYFPKHLFESIPPLLVGRPSWDNWLVKHSLGLTNGLVIDATPSITAIHQNHPYSSIGGRNWIWEGPEAIHNRSITGANPGEYYGTHKLKWELKKGKVIEKREISSLMLL